MATSLKKKVRSNTYHSVSGVANGNNGTDVPGCQTIGLKMFSQMTRQQKARSARRPRKVIVTKAF